MANHIYTNHRVKRMPTRVALSFMPGKRISGASQQVVGGTESMLTTDGDASGAHNNAAGETSYYDNYDIAPHNDDPARRRIHSHRRAPGIVRLMRKLWAAIKNRIRPQLTAEEIRQRERQKERDRIAQVLRLEMDICREQMINKLIDLGFCSKSENGRRVRGPQLDIACATENEIIYRVTYFPPGNSNDIDGMADDKTCSMLAESIGKPVTARFAKGMEDLGLMYFVSRNGTDGLPNVYPISDIMDSVPSTATELDIGLGVKANGVSLWRDIVEMPHMIVAGSTKGGKSNALHAIICQVLQRNSPDRVQLDLMDFKDGALEFSQYEGIPHLRTGRVIKRPDEMDEYFKGLMVEIKRRSELLAKRGKQTIQQYNRALKKSARMPYLLIVADEWALVVNELGEKQAGQYVKYITSQGRAFGVHLILATQYPRSDVVDPLTTINMQARLALYISTPQASHVICGSNHANTLIQPGQRGRAIFHFGSSDEHLIQIPLITSRQIKQIVAAAKQGTVVDKLGGSLDPEEVIKWAIDNNGGRLGKEAVYKEFEPRGVSMNDIKSLLMSMDGQDFEIGEVFYTVELLGGNGGRRVKLLSDDENSAPAPTVDENNRPASSVQQTDGDFTDEDEDH